MSSWQSGGSDRPNSINFSWIWIIIAIVIFSALASGHGGWMWWAIFPLMWWIVPTLIRAFESPEQREWREQRRAARYQWKEERRRARHPERYATWDEMSKRKNDDADSLDDLVDEKRKNGRNPRYVLIGDGEVMQVDGDEPTPDSSDNDIEPPLHSTRDSEYI